MSKTDPDLDNIDSWRGSTAWQAAGLTLGTARRMIAAAGRRAGLRLRAG